MKRILSIDGGGIRGIIPAMIIEALEEKLQKLTKDRNTRVADYFDFMAGTSTGGILTCLYNCPEDGGAATGDGLEKRPRFSAKEATDLYRKNGDRIFKVGFIHRALAEIGMTVRKYDVEDLETLLAEYFTDVHLSELLKPCLITAYDVELRQTTFFTKNSAERRGKGADFLVRDVCRATSAAPSYFDPAEIFSRSKTRHALVDGGIFANNPTLCAVREVKKENPVKKMEDMFILSLGTGSSNKPVMLEKLQHKAALLVVPDLIDMMMSGVSSTTHSILQTIFGDSEPENSNYHRIDPSDLGSASSRMDLVDNDNINRLVAVGEDLASDQSWRLDIIAQKLVEIGKKNEQAAKN